LHFKEVFSRWNSAFAKNGWLSIFLSNHDQARMVSRFGNDSPAFRDLSAKMLATFIMTMRGTPYFYNGDELGMTNIRFNKIQDYRDMSIINEYQHQKDMHADTLKFLELEKFVSRDNGRTPFQWNNSSNAGFTTGTPWIQVNPNYTYINEAMEDSDPNSCLNYFRRLVRLRKNNLILVYGKYNLLDKENPKVYAYTREGEGKKFLILLNFSATNAQTRVGRTVKNILLSNYNNNTDTIINQQVIELRPYEAIICLLK
jgi:oligo-1,6-glucosidase